MEAESARLCDTLNSLLHYILNNTAGGDRYSFALRL